MVCEHGQAGAYKEYKGHGVCVPNGLCASWIMEGAWVLEREFEVAPFTSRHMVSAVLEAILPLIHLGGTSQHASLDETTGLQSDASR